MTGKKTWIYIYTGSSGAKSILQREGVGRLRYLSCRILWLQNVVGNGGLKFWSISRHTNPADIGAKRPSAPRMKSLMAVLGSYNRATGNLEGNDDPGRVFVRRRSIKTLASALIHWWSYRLINWTKGHHHDVTHCGCDCWSTCHPSSFKLCCVFKFRVANCYWWYRSLWYAIGPWWKWPAWAWCILEPRSDAGFIDSRCQRRFAAAETETKRHLYRERMQVVRDVMAACRSGDASTKMAAAEMTRSMSDLSNHENSPNSHLLQHHGWGWASGWGWTANCCTCTWALGACYNFWPCSRWQCSECIASDSAEYMETNSQRLVRYRNAQMCEVSDIDEWMELHHGMSDDEESEDPWTVCKWPSVGGLQILRKWNQQQSWKDFTM